MPALSTRSGLSLEEYIWERKWWNWCGAVRVLHAIEYLRRGLCCFGCQVLSDPSRPGTAACQASLSRTISWSLPKEDTVTYPSKSRSQTHHLHPSSFIYIILIALRFVSFSFLFSFPLFSFYFVLLSILLPPLFLPSFLHKQNSYNEVRHPLARMWLEMARLPGTRASRRLPLLLLPAA